MRRAKKIDTNQPDIVKELRSIPGISVELDCNDILVGYKNCTYWYEIKHPDAISKKTGVVRPSELKDSQKRLLREWKGHYRVVSSAAEILTELGIKWKHQT